MQKPCEYRLKISSNKVDHGVIILQKTVPVHDDDTDETLSARILEQEHRAYPEAIAADLVAAVKDAQAYCFKTYANMTDAKGSEMMKIFGYQMAKLTVLTINTAHTDEHYGNMVTYMRLKGIVPPTSEKAETPAK